MKTISKKELNDILKKHSLWLETYGDKGERANLENANLRDANLENADLRYANLRDANLGYANLRYANLELAKLENANLRDANLENADLRYANLENANLEFANLRYAKLEFANLRYAKLEYVTTNHMTLGYHLTCPEEGSFIGYKKANNCLVKLLIPEDAKRSSATTLKCRCEKAKVLEIINLETDEKVRETFSDWNEDFIYKIGEVVKVDNFDDDRWNECSTGIHFFMNKENAINY